MVRCGADVGCRNCPGDNGHLRLHNRVLWQDEIIVTIAGSVGSAEELSKLLRQLPKSFTRAMFIVVRTAPDGPGLLAEILDHASQLPVHNPKHGEPIKPGHIYVAKPNHHLLVLPGHIELGIGPSRKRFSSRCRPLFRDCRYGPRVVALCCPAVWTMERLDSKPSNSTEV
jgi:chemotaxis response regulator CheB